jgi:hypothetical protein
MAVFFAIIEILIFYVIGDFSTPYPITHDNSSLGLPARFFISTSLRAGIFPLWDPYLGAGTPFLSIYISYGISPIVWMLSIFKKYDITLFVIEILILNFLSFIGMFYWLKTNSSRIISLLGAFSFSLSPYLILNSKISLDMVASAVAIPYICLGTVKIFKQNSFGIPLLAGGLGLAFTSGYLGMNILMIESLLTYLFFIFLITTPIYFSNLNKKIMWINFKNSIIYFIITAVLLLAIAGPLIAETFINLSIKFFTERTLNPFIGSIQLQSLANLFDNKSEIFTSDEYGGHKVLFFIPSIMLAGLFYGFIKPSKVFVSALIACACIFVVSLSAEYEITKFLVQLLPGFSQIRFHGSLVILMVFLLLTASTQGLMIRVKFSQSNLRAIFCSVDITLFVILLTFITAEEKDWLYLIITATILFASLILFQFLKAEPKKGGGGCKLIFINGCILLITLFQIYYVHFRQDEHYYNKYFDIQSLALQKQDSKKIANASPIFATPPNTRDLIANYRDSENPHYQKKPLVKGYLPQINPSITTLINEGQISLLEFYLIDEENLPIKYEIESLTPNKISLRVLEDIAGKVLILTIPYSPNWKFAGEEREGVPQIQKDTRGLMKIKPDKNLQVISLEYFPPYIYLLLFISLSAWLIIAVWLFWGVQAHILDP